jgi:ubiquinone/menaquinone biosynthesis C-methylase UbiE
MMANEFRTLNSHSAEYFGDTRDYWWNLDFLELIGKRLSLDRVQDVLDVGSGVGHWGQLLAKILPSRVRVQGVDRDPLWIEKATARAAALGLADRFSYQVAVAEKLPFPDASFDLVTCQTVLIHMPDPGATVDEMVRVARPGALILAAEPNNAARALLFDSVSFHDPVDDILTRARLQLICERGKAALGEGNNSIGDLVPSLFAERNLVDVCVYLNDKADILLPPYDSPDNAPRSKSAQTSTIAASGPVGAARSRVDIFWPAVVVRLSSKPCGWLRLAATTNSTRQSPTGRTPGGRERASATLSPEESQGWTVQDCETLRYQRAPSPMQ